MPDRKADILIIDGEPANLQALRVLLEPLGQRLVSAASAEEALRLVLTHHPAVIVLDVSAPSMDGFGIVRILRQCEQSRRTPIICLTTASGWPVPVPGDYEIGPVDYVLKPVVAEVLRYKVSIFVELRSLGTRLTAIRDEERMRIAREIHDELGQALTSLKMDAASLETQFGGKRHPARARIERMHKLIDSTVRLVQRVSTGMRPEILDELGLAAALRWQAREFERRTGIRCRLRLPGQHLALDAEPSTALFRAFQEILTNVARHARANSVTAFLEASDDRLFLEAADDGVGIPQDRIRHRDSLGLLGMRERAEILGGGLTISGKPGRGTTVSVTIPLRAAASRDIGFDLPPPRQRQAVALDQRV